MFSLICVWINGWLNNREAGDLIRYRAHYDVSVKLGIDMYKNNVFMAVDITSGFYAQMARDAENVSMSWRHNAPSPLCGGCISIWILFYPEKF